MGFDLQTWKQAAAAKLGTAGQWLGQRGVKDAPYLVYGTLCGLSIWPLVQAAQSGEFLPAMMALGSVAGGVGGNLLAEQVQRWKDRAAEVGEAEVTAWAGEQAAADPGLRQALDAILEELEALPRAQAALEEGDRAWFAATLRRELEQLGNLPRFEATLAGAGAVAQGAGAQAASGRSVVARRIQGQVVTGDRAIGAGGHVVQAGERATVIIGEGAAAAEGLERQAALARYLRNLQRLCNALPLAALAEEEGAHRRAEITLNRVYISLDTTAQVPLAEEEKARRQAERPWLREEARPLPALEAAAGEARLAILGDPGSGKSTFVNYLAYLLAAARLGEGDLPQGWPHGPLLPLRVLLRELAASLPGEQDLKGLSAEKRASRLVGGIWAHVGRELATTYRAEDALPALERAVDDCQALVIFDGLDEVALEGRRLVREAVEAFGRLCGENRVLVTCRVRSYRQEPPLRAFADVGLAPFGQEQVDEFVARWYRALADLGTLNPPDAERRAGNLRSAVRPLMELAGNPLLLTTMAVVHTAQVELPRERARLYQRCVDVLLRRWHKHKAGEAPLLEQLGLSESELLAALREVACEAQQRGGTREEGDLPRGEVLRLLAARLGGYGPAEQFLDYVDTRAGLLVGRGGSGEPVYTFPHRTFQEYLAGCHLALGGRDFGRRLRGLLGQGDRWSLAARLGAEHLLYNVGHLTPVLDAAYSLCPVAETAGEAGWRGVLWAGQLAAEVGPRKFEEDRDAADGGAVFLERLVPRLVRIMREGRLGAVERAAAGRALARVGDPRPGATTVEGMELCYVPPGPFWMGSGDDDPLAYPDEKPQHEREVPYGYWLARLPVTQAQFRVFVEAGGYGRRAYWAEAERAGVWDRGWVKAQGEDEPREAPRDYGGPFDLPNQPVVGVTWYEALAFCRWLAERLRWAGSLPGGWEARLPAEAEWEKAARGGVQVPEMPAILPAGACPGAQRAGTLRSNPLPRRRYPWGDGADPERANYADTGIGSTSAVGCFPRGASPYGVEELSGNVLEWCQTKWQGSYEGYRDDNDPAGDAHRVWRGGAFDLNERSVRCASRDWGDPDGRNGNVGFRVVVAPVSL